MRIKLSDHFGYSKLLRFVLPSVIMMMFTSIYGIVDGLFVSNFVGKTAFASVNLVIPLLMVIGSVGFMIGAGGSAVVAKTLGEGEEEKAKRYFSMLVAAAAILGIFFSAMGMIFIRPISMMLGARGGLTENCVLYGRITLISLPAFMLQNVFQSFFVTAEKPKLGLAVTVAAGVTNMLLDLILVGVLSWGIAGAAIATAASEFLGGGLPLIYFARRNKSLLRLTKTRLYGRILLRACTNGSSELMTNVSMSLVNMLYNIQLMRFIGEDGVAAYGVIMYVSFVFVSIFLGYSIGSAPLVGYNYGAENISELQNIFRKSMMIVAVVSVALVSASFFISVPLSKMFVGYDDGLFEVTLSGFRLFALSYLICGFNIYSSSFFTALNNGAVSALISFLRTLVFQIAAVFILPLFLGINGIWLSVVFAELMSILVTVTLIITQNKKYHYIV